MSDFLMQDSFGLKEAFGGDFVHLLSCGEFDVVEKLVPTDSNVCDSVIAVILSKILSFSLRFGVTSTLPTYKQRTTQCIPTCVHNPSYHLDGLVSNFMSNCIRVLQLIKIVS